jgi:hypothetical protein
MIFTAVIPGPGTDPETQGVHFAAKVDLLEIVETGLPSPYDGSGADFVKVAFLVHDQAELDYLRDLADLKARSAADAFSPSTAHAFTYDSSFTQQLRDQINRQDDAERGRQSQQFSTISGYSCYKDLQGSFDWMTYMVNRATSIANLSITRHDIGDSYLKSANPSRGYDMWALKITGDGVAAAGRTTEKGVLFIMSGIHAREYAPPELVSRWAESLVDSYGSDADITSILDHTEIHIVLHSNPDGRRVAETDRNAFRRKNLNPNEAVSTCSQDSLGVDLNRNFPFRWGRNDGSSGNKCSETYRGPSPASEPEVQAIVSYCQSIFPAGQRKQDPEAQQQVPYGEDALGIFLDIHSYGELVIWPWVSYVATMKRVIAAHEWVYISGLTNAVFLGQGHQNLESGNDSGLETLSNKYRHFNGHTLSGPKNGFSYPASGASDDWAYGTLGAAGMTFEIGNEFYQSCSYFESSVLPSNLPALTYAAKSSKAPYSTPMGPDITSLSVDVNNNSLSVMAVASDAAYSSTNFASSQQGVSAIRVFVDIHPDDAYAGSSPSGTVLSSSSSGTLAVDVSGLSDGRHVVYVQATDGAGYKGPVTAAYFDVKSSIPNPVGECVDSTSRNFYVDKIGLTQDCTWLVKNIDRFSYLCRLLDVAASCPNACNACSIFG